MADKNLVDYVKSCIDSNIPIEKIRSDLYAAGWKKPDVEQAVSLAQAQSAPQKAAAPAKQAGAPRKKLYTIVAVALIIVGAATFYLISSYISSTAPAQNETIIKPPQTGFNCSNSVCESAYGETYELCPADCPAPLVNTNVTITLNPKQAAVSSGSSVTFQVEISEVSNFYGFQFDLIYDPASLQFSQATTGVLIKKDGSSPLCLDPIIKQGAQNTMTIACTRMGSAGVDGSGILESVTFTALSSGTAAPTLSNVKLADSSAPSQAINFRMI